MSDEQQAPQRIWLQWYGWSEENTWCVDKINDEDVEYIRADAVDELEANHEELQRLHETSYMQGVAD